jgi:membrane peptidoglycan carboxypeptidase
MFNIEPLINGLHASGMELEQRDLGIQPLDAIMERWGVTNHDLVEDSPEQLTHKQIQRAKAGRRLTMKMMMKVARSLNIAIWNRLSKENKETFVEYLHKEIFSYSKDYNPDKSDPNEVMILSLAKVDKK